MSTFNYRNLSTPDFEALALDVMQRILGVNLYRFGLGSDDGIDLCNNIETLQIVVQCKNYQQGSFNRLFSDLKVEKEKVVNLNPQPKQYYIFTGLELLPQQKIKVFELFRDYMEDESFIIDGIAINEFFRNNNNHDLIDRNIKLFKSFPDNYDENKYIKYYSFQAFIDSINEKKESSNSFHYLNPDIEFRGRVTEYNALKRFLDEKSSFLFWAITGPGGIGKSKLVYSLMKEYHDDSNWKMVFLSNDYLERILEISEYRYYRNLLIVIDYAGSKAKIIGEWIQRIISGKLGNTPKLRILLLERLGFNVLKNPNSRTEERVVPEWFAKIITPISEGTIVDKSEILKYKYSDPRYSDFLTLGNLRLSDYYDMMDDLVKSMKKEMKDESIDFLNDKQKKEVIKFIDERNPNSKEINPLYVLLTTYAAAKGENYNNWSTNEGILSSVYERDFQSWKKNFPENDLRNSLINLLAYTTSVKRWVYGEKLPDFLKWDEKVIANYRRNSPNDPISNWNALLTGQQSNSENVLLSPLEPDIIGEYYVLRYFVREFKISYESKYEWCALFCANLEQCVGFFERCILDFGNSSLFGIFLEILRTINDELHEQKDSGKEENEIENKLYHILETFISLWEHTDGEYKEEAINCLQSVLEDWKDESVTAAEKYIEIWYYRNSKKGKRRKNLDNRMKPLCEKWPKSSFINIAYIENLGELGKNSIVSGTEKGKSKGLEIADTIQKQYDSAQDKAVLEACVIALGKILTAAYQEEGINESFKKEMFEKLYLNKANNSSNAINFIETCSSIVIAQYKHSEKSDWKSTFRLFIDIIYKNKERNFDYEWRLGDVLLSLIKTFLEKKIESEVYELIDLVYMLADDSYKTDTSTGMYGGLSWHWRRIIERILEMNIPDEIITNRLQSLHKLLLKGNGHL